MANATIPQGQIQQRAYEIFQSRGAKQGKALDDWLQAERELLNVSQSKQSQVSEMKKSRQHQLL